MKHEKIDIPALPGSDENCAELLCGAIPAEDRRSYDREDASRRQHPRVEVRATVRLRGAGQGGVDGVIDNLSAGGCSLAVTHGSFGEGDLVVVKLDGVEPWPGMVKWSADGLVGIAFYRPFYPAVFDAIVAAHNTDEAKR